VERETEDVDEWRFWRQADVLDAWSDSSQKHAVITQTCDIVSTSLPNLQLAPVVASEGHDAAMAREGNIPHLINIPLLGAEYFTDLNGLQSIPRELVHGWSRTPGVGTLEEQVRFANLVGRYFSRFPLPDHVAQSLKGLREVAKDKHKRPQSAQGQLLQSIRGIHVRAVDEGGWSTATTEVELFFVTEPGTLPVLDEPCGTDADVARWIGSKNLDSIAQHLLAEGEASRRQQLWNGFVDCWVDKCAKVSPLKTITWQMEDADLVKVATIDSYVLLDLAYLSW
jgi:hypothetical protein